MEGCCMFLACCFSTPGLVCASKPCSDPRTSLIMPVCLYLWMCVGLHILCTPRDRYKMTDIRPYVWLNMCLAGLSVDEVSMLMLRWYNGFRGSCLLLGTSTTPVCVQGQLGVHVCMA
jgi:hypothetical protein